MIGDGMSLVNMVINLFDSEVIGGELSSSGREEGGRDGSGRGEQVPEGAWVTPPSNAKIAPTQVPSNKQQAPVGAANLRKKVRSCEEATG